MLSSTDLGRTCVSEESSSDIKKDSCRGHRLTSTKTDPRSPGTQGRAPARLHLTEISTAPHRHQASRAPRLRQIDTKHESRRTPGDHAGHEPSERTDRPPMPTGRPPDSRNAVHQRTGDETDRQHDGPAGPAGERLHGHTGRRSRRGHRENSITRPADRCPIRHISRSAPPISGPGAAPRASGRRGWGSRQSP